ncbi:MAG TPA: TrkA family potassium uptake protein [Halobacteriales archaeon]|nr:TrkA family potassium uptake protein [Halobacteriales archaeon]
MSGDGGLRVLVVGSGRVGLATVRLLADRGHDIVVIERRPDRCKQLADEYLATVIEGDAGRPSVLKQADLERTDVVAALTDTPGTNLSVCLAAERIAPGVRTVMRTIYGDEDYTEFADAVVFPEAAGARAVTNVIEVGVDTLEATIGDLEIFDLEVAEGAPVAGRALADVALPRGSLVVSDADGESVAGADTVLEVGRTFVVAAEPGVTDEVMNLFRG